MNRDALAEFSDRVLMAPRSAWPLALARMVLGLTVLVWTLTLLIDVGVFMGSDAIISSDFADTTFQIIPIDSTGVAVAMLLALMAYSVAIVIGFRPTIFLLVAFVLVVQIQRRNPAILNSGDIIMRNLLLLLACCPTAAACSLDRVRRLGRDALFTSAQVAPWGMRLVQLQMMVVYFFAFWSKSGPSWRDGTAVSISLRIQDLQRIGQFDFLVESVPLVAILTWGTLAVELVLALLLWVKRLRIWLLVLAAALHLSIDVLMLVGFFMPAMAAGLCTFLDGEAIQRRVDARRARRAEDAPATT